MMNIGEILNMFRQGKATAGSHLKNLIEMASADGEFTGEEEALLKKLAARHGISARRLEEIRSQPASNQFEKPEGSLESYTQLHELVHMMVVDNNIHPEELRLTELFAIRYGYARRAIPGIIKIIRRNIESGVDVKKSYEDVQYYLEWA